MTSTTDTAGHPDVAEISDLTEGLLTPSRSADLRRHLDDCTDCADVHASLEEIRGLLGDLGDLGELSAPEPMPEDVVLRVDAALAREAAEAKTPAGAMGAVKSPVLGDVSRETADGVSRETPSPGRPAGYARTSSTGPGRKGKSTGKATDRPRSRRRTAALVGVFTAAAVGLGTVLLTSLGGSSGTTAGRAPSTAADTFSKSSLHADVTKILPKSQSTNRSSHTPHADVGIQGGAETPRVLQEPNVPACVQQGIDRTDAALAAKEGVYDGKDVLLVVYVNTGDSSRVDAYVVDAACVRHPSSQATVLLKDTYARS